MQLISHFSKLKIRLRLLVLCFSTAEKIYNTKFVNFEILNDDKQGQQQLHDKRKPQGYPGREIIHTHTALH
jgi:hypothetical protein